MSLIREAICLWLHGLVTTGRITPYDAKCIWREVPRCIKEAKV